MVFGQLQLLPVEIENIPHPHELPVAQDSGNGLRNGGGQGHAGNTHTELCHKQQIQTHIQRRGDQQEHQSGEGIAEATEHTGEHIVEEKAYNADEENIQIVSAPVDDTVRRAQQLQHRTGDQRADDHNDHRGNTCQRDAVADILRQTCTILCAIALGDDDTGTGGDAHEQSQQQIQNGCGAADSCQRVIAHKLTDNNRVCRVIQLLGQIADEHGHGKFHDPLPRCTLGHIPGCKETFDAHNILPFLFCFIVAYFQQKTSSGGQGSGRPTSWVYSYRKASMGSILAALLAG